jgi:hypothetical protein
MNALLEILVNFRRMEFGQESSHNGENNVGLVADAAECNGSDHDNLDSGQIMYSKLSAGISP